MPTLSTERLKQITSAPWFTDTAAPYLIVDTDLRIRATNRTYDHATRRARGSLLDEYVFDAFPDDPAKPWTDGVERLSGSLEFVFRLRRRHWLGIQRYDIPDPDNPSVFIDKVWVPVNSPIDEAGRTVGALHHVEDVTILLDPRSLRSRARERGIRQAARRLAAFFPELAYEAVLGALAQSHRIVLQVLGASDANHAEKLAMLRLEVMTGHPAVGSGDDI